MRTFYAQSLACSMGNHHLCLVEDAHGNPCPCRCHRETHAAWPTRTTDTKGAT